VAFDDRFAWRPPEPRPVSARQRPCSRLRNRIRSGTRLQARSKRCV